MRCTYQSKCSFNLMVAPLNKGIYQKFMDGMERECDGE